MTDKAPNPDMHYQTHVFCCVNERAPDHPRSCCSARGSVELMTYMKTRAKELGISGIRVNNAGCMERCELGPTMVIYPEGVWYHYETRKDVDEILERHIIKAERVERLQLPAGQKFFEPEAKEPLKLKVADIHQGTPDIKVLELVPTDGAPLPEVAAGAHIDVIAGDGKRRSYSIANDPGERHRYVIGVLREPGGRGGSAWLHDKVGKGDTLDITPPLNNFPLADSASEYIFIAGGIGITPILAMGYQLRADGAKFTLHYCTRSPEQTVFMDEVKEVFGENAIFHHDGGDPYQGINLKQVLGTRPDGAHLYVCGPAGLMAAVMEATAGWPEESLHQEFFSADPSSGEWQNEEFEISLARRKKILTVPVDKTILQVAREAGATVESSCEDGLCGTCRTVLLNGTPEHRDQVLTRQEKEENKTIMICTSRAKAGKRLVLDL